MPEADNWGWDWVNWGSAGGGGAPVYLISHSGGLVPPGEFVPLSHSYPEVDDKKDKKVDDKVDDKKDD